MKRDELRALLASQPDFMSVRSEIEELIESRVTFSYLAPNVTPSACLLKCAGAM